MVMTAVRPAMYVTLTPRYDSASPSFKKDFRAGSRFKAHPPHETISAVRAAAVMMLNKVDAMVKMRRIRNERMVVLFDCVLIFSSKVQVCRKIILL